MAKYSLGYFLLVLTLLVLFSPVAVFAGSGAGVAVKLEAVVTPGQTGGGTGGSMGCCSGGYPIPVKPSTPVVTTVAPIIPAIVAVTPPLVLDIPSPSLVVPFKPSEPVPVTIYKDTGPDTRLLFLVGGLVLLVVLWYFFKNKSQENS